MRRLSLLAVILLAACQMQAPKGAEPAPQPGLAAEEAITVTPLGTAPGKTEAASTAGTGTPPKAGPPAVAEQIPVQVPDRSTPRPKPRPADLGKPGAKPTPQASTPEEAPAPPISPEQALCEKSAGMWATLESGGNVCVHRTRDGGKVCHRKRDCQGECLSRSNTCAPIMPLMGCNDVLQANGTEVTLCLQ